MLSKSSCGRLTLKRVASNVEARARLASAFAAAVTRGNRRPKNCGLPKTRRSQGVNAMALDNPTVSISTEYLMTVEFLMETLVPPAPRGITNIPVGGTVHGPKINGTIIPPGGDWPYAMPDGTIRLDVRFTIKTDDGEFILTEYNAVVVPSKEVLDKFAKAETVNSNELSL